MGIVKVKKHHKWAACAAGVAIAVAVPVTSHVVTHSPTVVISAGAHCQARGLLPDPVCTPGVADPAVTQANIAQTICKTGYTATVRPPVSYTSKVKTQSYQQYGISPSVTAELDHLIPLELGGAPSDPRNLWVEVGSIPNAKDKVENRLHAEVCAGTITLADAQSEISTDWTQVK